MSVYYDEREDNFAELPLPINGTALAIIFGIIAIALVWFTVPRLLAELPAEKAADALADINHEAPLSIAELEEAIEAVDDALKFAKGSGELYVRRATLRQQRLVALGKNFDGELEKIRADALMATQYAPADPYAWYMLAYADQALENKLTDQGLTALRASILLGRSESALILPRITMGINYWDSLPPDVQTLVHNQIAIALRHWHLIKPFGTYVSNLDNLQAEHVMTIVESGPRVPAKGVRRLKNMTNLNIECRKDMSYSNDCYDLK